MYFLKEDFFIVSCYEENSHYYCEEYDKLSCEEDYWLHEESRRWSSGNDFLNFLTGNLVMKILENSFSLLNFNVYCAKVRVMNHLKSILLCTGNANNNAFNINTCRIKYDIKGIKKRRFTQVLWRYRSTGGNKESRLLCNVSRPFYLSQD